MSLANSLSDLQASVQDRSAFTRLDDYFTLCAAFLDLVERTRPTRIVSPTHNNYVFYQYAAEYGHRITRPLNTNLLIERVEVFSAAFARFVEFLAMLRRQQRAAIEHDSVRQFLQSGEVNRVVYTIQQAIGSIGDAFDNPNQSRKRVGQLFEALIRLIIQEVGLECEPRTIKLPIPGDPGCQMSYELDLVFSRNKAIITAETAQLAATEVVGSVKTTSKDRLDKIFLDKFLLTKLLGRDVPVIAVFLHDVQRARSGNSIFGINSTFKTNHFLGYTVALNRLDGVYYVDPRPEMTANSQLREQISDFQTLLTRDLWSLSERR
jgi:hypothetical protein